MGMRDYPVDLYGLYIDEKIGNAILNFFKEYKPGTLKDFFDNDEPNADELMEMLTEDDTVCYLFDAECEFEEICNEQNPSSFGSSNEDDRIYYIPLSKAPSLFKDEGYENFTEIVKEIRSKVAGILPDDYPIEDNIVHIFGTEFC